MSSASRKLLLLTAFLIAADQASKLLARRRLGFHETVELLPFLKLDLVRNSGISFGMLEGHATIVFITSSCIVLLLVLAAIAMRGKERLAIPMAFLLAGSAGNLIDRIFLGSVTDFLRIPHWPAFNLADVFILAGVGLLALQLIFPEGLRGR